MKKNYLELWLEDGKCVKATIKSWDMDESSYMFTTPEGVCFVYPIRLVHHFILTPITG
jgi:hypothetical protein